MAIYRIKQDRSLLEPPEQSQEYWREAKPGQESDLDFDEIRELNENIPEQEDELEPIPRFRSPWLTVLLGVVLILSFMICIGYSLFPQRFDFSLLIRSAEMAQDASLAALQQAVVKVETPSGGGSGFNIRPEGLIVTNAHVVEDRGFLTITFPESAGGQVFITKEYILIEGADLALIPIQGENLPAVELAEIPAAPGDEVIFIGNPRGYDWTISGGIILGAARDEANAALLFQGPVHPGSSGSPIFNDKSQVVGVIYATLASEEGQLGLAAPISQLTTAISDLLEEENHAK